jgi:hypothetical protein
MLERHAVVAQLVGNRRQRLGGPLQRLGGGDLRADVHVDTDEPQPLHVPPVAIDPARLFERHPELVDAQPGGDVGVRLGVDVGVDAQRYARGAAGGRGHGGNAIELTRRLGVDGADVLRHREFELLACLADAGEHDVGGREAGAKRDADLAAGVGVGTAAEFAQQAQQRQRRVRLERVVYGVRVLREGRVDAGVRAADGRRAVDEDRRTDFLGDGSKRHPVAGEAVFSWGIRCVHARSHVIMRRFRVL